MAYKPILQAALDYKPLGLLPGRLLAREGLTVQLSSLVGLSHRLEYIFVWFESISGQKKPLTACPSYGNS